MGEGRERGEGDQGGGWAGIHSKYMEHHVSMYLCCRQYNAVVDIYPHVDERLVE